MNINIKVEGMEVLTGKLQKLAKQIPYAAKIGINRMTKAIQDEEIKEMKKVFDRPTSWILNGTYLRGAEKGKLEGEIGLKDWAGGGGTPAVKVLWSEIFGGDRRVKRFEKALQAVGALPPGMVVVAGSGAQIDMHGNMKAQQIIQILSYFKAFRETGYRANITEEKRAKLKRGTKKKMGTEYFKIGTDHKWLQPGIYQKFHMGHGSAIKPVMIFVDEASYKKRFDFFGVGQRTIARVGNKIMSDAVRDAIATEK